MAEQKPPTETQGEQLAKDRAEELHDEGLRLFQEGLYDESAQRFSEAMEYFAEQGREIEVGEILNNIGIIRRKQGQTERLGDGGGPEL